MKQFLLVVILAIVAVSCGQRSENWTTIVDVESYIEERPDSALAVLREIDSSELSCDEERVRYALLMSMALDKNYVDLTNDSIIQIAEDYYKNTNDNRRKMLSYYYHARICYNAKLYAQSLCIMIKAFEYADIVNDYYWKGRIAEQMACIYLDNYHGEEGVNYAQKGYDNLRLSGRQPYVNFSLLTLARAYNNNRQYAESHQLVKQVLDSAYKYNDTLLLIRAKELLASTYLGINDCKNAINTILNIQDSVGISPNLRFLLGYSYLQAGEIEKAEEIYNGIEESYNINDISYKYEIAKRRKDYKTALYSLSQLYDNLDSIFVNSINQNFSQYISEFQAEEKKEKEAELAQAKENRNIVTTIGILMVIVIVIYIISYRRKSLRKLEKNILYAQNLQEILQLKETEYIEAQRSIRELLSTRFEAIDNLCRTYYENKATGLGKKKISAEVVKLIDDFSSDKNKIAQLEEFVNRNAGGLIDSFKTALPNLKEADYLLFLYASVGFSNTAIALFLREEKLDAVYNRKARLKTKIKKLDLPNVELYLNILS